MKVWSIIDEHITRPRADFPGRPPAFWPSEASVVMEDAHGDKVIEGKCLRAVWLRFMIARGKVKPIPMRPAPYMAYIWEYGKLMEDKTQELLKEAGVWVDSNVKFYHQEKRISGEFDVLIWDHEAKAVVPVEHKSAYGYHAQKEVIGNWKQPGKPKWSNLLQTALYLDLFRDRFPHGYLMYILRDSMDRTEFKISITNHDAPEEERRIAVDGYPLPHFTMRDVYSRFETVQQYIDNEEMPPNDFQKEYTDEQIEDLYSKKKLSKAKYTAWKKKGERPGHWTCTQYCEHQKFCWGTSGGGVWKLARDKKEDK